MVYTHIQHMCASLECNHIVVLNTIYKHLAILQILDTSVYYLTSHLFDAERCRIFCVTFSTMPAVHCLGTIIPCLAILHVVLTVMYNLPLAHIRS